MWKLQQPNRVDLARVIMMSPWLADHNRERAAMVCRGMYVTNVLRTSAARTVEHHQCNLVSVSTVFQVICDAGLYPVISFSPM